jgi:hypothetical protein
MVKAYYENGGTCVSEIGKFSTIEGNLDIDSIYPDDGEHYIPLNTSLEWDYSGNLDDAVFNIYFSKQTSPSFFRSVVGSEFLDLTNLDPESAYYWKVEALVQDEVVAISPVNSFNTRKADNYPPEKPTNPYPRDYGNQIPTDLTLSWSCSDIDGDPLSFDVFFGTSSYNLEKITDKTEVEFYYLENLAYDQQYYWKVNSSDGKKETQGEVWSFKTLDDPDIQIPIVHQLSPQKNAKDVETNCVLSWTGENANSYDVYFGESSSPPYYETTTDQTLSLSLEKGKTYYWQIVAKNGEEETYSMIWDFTTEFGIEQADEVAREMLSYARNSSFIETTTFSADTNWGSMYFKEEYLQDTYIDDFYFVLRATIVNHQDVFFPLEARVSGPELGSHFLLGRFASISELDNAFTDEAVTSISLEQMLTDVERIKFFFSNQWYNLELFRAP